MILAFCTRVHTTTVCPFTSPSAVNARAVSSTVNAGFGVKIFGGHEHLTTVAFTTFVQESAA